MEQLHDGRAFRRGRSFRGKRCLAALLLLLAVMAGCNRERFSFVPVTGKITYTDNTLIQAEKIKVRLVALNPAQDGKDFAPAATGEVNPNDGTFAGVTSVKPLDGVVPGRYRVMVMALARNEKPNGAVPAKYLSATQSPLLIEVTREKHDFPQLQVEKPK
jgi:hypothetical protein